jgi:hypothetical protein
MLIFKKIFEPDAKVPSKVTVYYDSPGQYRDTFPVNIERMGVDEPK